jgi:diaminohydroxyphosphoribosylaminopyrimidine deaminase/5-amino-6-(5-phosphoribosylamino)uracil reductase
MTEPATDSRQLDERFMALALREAENGVGLTSPNPPVGAVVVSAGAVIGAGYHRKAGGPHAEVAALADATAQAPDKVPGSTVYVTLEPCSTHGKTPACTAALVKAGVARVVYGAADPNPAHAGRADALLRQAGISVTSGVLQAQCADLIRPFTKWITTGLPYVIAKAGQTLDGRITRPPGEPQWITSETARAHGRALTLRRDNPLLTLRDTALINRGKTQPWRIVLTRGGALPEGAHLFTDEFKDRTLVLRNLEAPDVLRELARREITSVLVEGGAVVLGQFFSQGLVDEAHWFIAPRFSGSGARPSIDGPALARSVEMTGVRVLPLGDNVLVSGYPVFHRDQPPEPAPTTPPP